jgi:hypothetical protein
VFHGIVRRPPAPRVHGSRTRKVLWLASASCAVAVLAAGCGSSSGSAASSSATPKTASMSAYRTCLSQHGVKLRAFPTARPTATPTARPTGFASPSAAVRKAMTACASLRPKNAFGFGAGGARFEAAFKAFRSCMSAHGEAIPTTRPTARPTATPSPGASPNPDRFLNGLNPNNAKVAAALKACESKLPTFGGGGGAGG